MEEGTVGGKQRSRCFLRDCTGELANPTFVQVRVRFPQCWPAPFFTVIVKLCGFAELAIDADENPVKAGSDLRFDVVISALR